MRKRLDTFVPFLSVFAELTHELDEKFRIVSWIYMIRQKREIREIYPINVLGKSSLIPLKYAKHEFFKKWIYTCTCFQSNIEFSFLLEGIDFSGNQFLFFARFYQEFFSSRPLESKRYAKFPRKLRFATLQNWLCRM